MKKRILMNYLEKEIYELIRYDDSIFNFIQESSLDGFWYWDLENPEHEWMDNKFWATLGYDSSTKRHLASEWQDIINQDDLKVAYENFTKHCNDPSHPYDQEVRYTHKEGHTVWIRCKGIAIRNESGKAIRMLGAHTDITKLKEAEIESKKKTERYQYIIDGAGIGTWETHLKTQEFVLNEGWAKIIGYSLNEVGPLEFDNLKTYVHEDDLDDAVQLFKDHLKGKLSFFEHEVRMRHKDGSWKWILVRGRVVSWSNDGKYEWAAGSTQDITDRKKQEISLKKYKDLLVKTNEAASIGTWELDLQDNTVMWSSITKKIYEVDQDYSPNFDKSINFYPEGDHRIKAEFVVANAISKGESFDHEFQILTASNKLKWIRVIGTSEFENGKCSRLYGLVQDIDELKKEFDRNKFFIEQAPSAIAMFDTNMLYVATSQKWLQYYEIEDQQIKGKSLYEVFPEIGRKWRKVHQDCLKGEVITCKEEAIKRKDGTELWLTWEVKPWYISEGQIGGIIIYTADITYRKEAEEKLRVSEETFRRSFENAAIGMATIDPLGKWVKVNGTLCDMLGYSWEELQVLSFRDITHPDDLEADLKLLDELIAGKRTFYHIEKRYIHKNGNVIWGVLSVSFVKDNKGLPLYFVSQVTDITLQKNARLKLELLTDQLTEQNEQLVNFAHIVSHNLRAPVSNLNSLLMYYDVLKDEQEKNLVFDKFKTVIDHLTSTLNTLLDSISIKTATLTEKEQLTFDEVMNKTLEILSGHIIETDAKAKSDFSQSPKITYNRDFLESIFLNLLSNALKYRSPDRRPEISVNTKENKGRVIMQVKDNGLGIDLEKHGDKLFGLNKTFHRHSESKGVGLYLVKTQIENMGGTISATSQVNKGTTFTIKF